MASGKIERVWVVRDPSDRSVLEDICFELSVQELVNYIRGAEEEPGTWESEKTILYYDNKTAFIDAGARLIARDLGVL